MTALPAEPPRKTNLDLLEPYVKERVQTVLANMQARGFDPVVWETLRTKARQTWLFGYGRRWAIGQRPHTWTMHSYHLADTNGLSKAVDIISRSRGYNWPKFFAALDQEYLAAGLHDAAAGTTFRTEQCHGMWTG